MRTCPVCDRQTEGLLCPACGYDASQNREAYPTLAPIPTEIKAISTLKATWQARHQDLIRCPSCGGIHFTLNRTTLTHTCATCNTPLPEEALKPLPTNPDPLPSLTSQIPPEGCRVVVAGDNYHGRCNVDNWQNIVALSISDFHTVGLKSDGTVVATGNQDHQECATNRWKNIKDIAARNFITYGLQADGTVVFTEYQYDPGKVKKWRDIRSITCSSSAVAALTNNNTVLTTRSAWKDAEKWTDIIAIATTRSALFGLRRDGTVAAVCVSPHDYLDVQNWKDITAIAAGESHIVGLKNDGTVIAVGNNEKNQCAVSSWNNIIALAAGDRATAGIRADGTVVCTNPAWDLSGWQRIVAVAVAWSHIVALQLSEEQYAAQLHFKE